MWSAGAAVRRCRCLPGDVWPSLERRSCCTRERHPATEIENALSQPEGIARHQAQIRTQRPQLGGGRAHLRRRARPTTCRTRRLEFDWGSHATDAHRVGKSKARYLSQGESRETKHRFGCSVPDLVGVGPISDAARGLQLAELGGWSSTGGPTPPTRIGLENRKRAISARANRAKPSTDSDAACPTWWG